MIEMELNQTGANAWTRWSPTTSPRGAVNKSSRSRSGIDGSASPDKDVAAEKYRRGSDHSRLHEEYELDDREIPRKRKRGRYSDHHKDKNFADSFERRHYSCERLPLRHETESGDEERHELSKSSRFSHKRRCQRDSSRNGLLRKDPLSGNQTNVIETGRSSKWRSYDDKCGYRVDHSNSLSWNGSREEAKNTGAPNSSQQNSVANDLDSNIKTGNSLSCTSSTWIDETNAKHATGFRRSSATKWDTEETNNRSSWSGSNWGAKATAKNAPSSSLWRSESSNNDKWCSNVKIDNISSWPAWDNETTAVDAPKSSSWRTNADRQGTNIKTANTSSWPKWDDKTTANEPNSSSWRTDDDRRGPIMKTDSSLSWPKWDGDTNTENAPNSSRWRANAVREDSCKKTENSLSWPNWDDKTTTKDAPNSSKSKGDAGREGSYMKTGNSSSWSEWDDKITTKDESNTSHWRTTADRKGFNVKAGDASSWRKRNAETNLEDAPNSSCWRSAAGKQGSNVKTLNSPSWPKWEDELNTDAPNSSEWRKTTDKLHSNMKTDSSSLWPEWDDKRTTMDAPTSLWRTSADIRGETEATAVDAPKSCRWTNVDGQGSKMKTGNCSSWPKCDDKTTIANEPNFSSWRTDDDRRGPITKTDSSLSSPKWDGKKNTENASNSSRWRANAGREHSCKKTDNSLSWLNWDDKTTIKDAPNFSQWRGDAGREGSYMKTGNSSSWSKWDDKINTEYAPNSSHWRTTADRKGSNAKAGDASWPKRDAETNLEDAPNSSCWRSAAGEQGSNAKNLNSPSWPKWEDELNTDAPNSSQWRKTTDRLRSTDSSSSWPKWDDKRTTVDAPTSLWRTSADIWGETSNISTWRDTKRGDWTTTTSMTDSSRCRLDNDKQANNVETSRNLSKWDGHRNTRDAPNSSRWRFDGDKKDFDAKIGNVISLDCPKWADGTKAKDFPNSSHYRSDGERKQYDVKASRIAPKWDVQTTKKDSDISFRGKSADAKNHCYKETKNSSLRDVPNFGDESTTKNGNSSCCTSDINTQDPIVGNSSILRNNPKWSDQTADKDTLYSSGCPSDNAKMKAEKTSWDCVKWSDSKTAKVAPKHSLQSPDDEKQDYNVNTNSCFLLDASKLDDQIIAKVSANLSQQSSDSGNDHGVKTDNGLSQNDLHQDDHTIPTVAPKTNDWRSDADKKDYTMETDNIVLLNGLKLADQGSADSSKCPQQKSESDKWGYDQETDYKISQSVPKNVTEEALSGSLPSHAQNITQKATRKDQHILNISKFRNLNEVQTQQTAYSISTTGKDSMPQPCGQGLKPEWHSHQVGSCKQQSQSSASLKPLTDEASAGTTVPLQPSLSSQSTEPITSGSRHFEHLTIVRKSQKSPRILLELSSKNAQCSDGDVSWASNLEGILQHGKQGSKEAELIRDALTEASNAKTSQSKEEQNTSNPNATDCDMKKVWETDTEDEKGIRLFKFALVNFVKDILRPIWKEGRLSKDTHKIIVKKVVDKVTGALHGNSIPRRQKDIDLYISCSKEKLTNFVKAYLEYMHGAELMPAKAYHT